MSSRATRLRSENFNKNITKRGLVSKKVGEDEVEAVSCAFAPTNNLFFTLCLFADSFE